MARKPYSYTHTT